jgi:tetratricopeptide (TPR) repeat protein
MGRGYTQQVNNEESISRAIQRFQDCIKADPDYSAAHEGLAKAYFKKYLLTQDNRNLEMAQSHSRKAIRLSPYPFFPHMVLGSIYHDTNKTEEAIAEFDQALKIEPRSFDAHLSLALTYEREEKLQEAEDTYKRALALRPDYWYGYENLGYFYWTHGRPKEAEKQYREVIRISPERMETYAHLGVLSYMSENMDSAISLFEKSNNIKKNLTACSNLGTLYFFNGRYIDAVTSYMEALKFDDNDYTVWENLGDTYRQMPGSDDKQEDSYARASQLVQGILASNPDDSMARASLAYYSAISGQREKAATEIRQALQLAPSNVVVLLQAVKVFELIDRRDEALRILRDYIENGGAMILVHKNPDLTGLRSDPTFQKLTRTQSR